MAHPPRQRDPERAERFIGSRSGAQLLLGLAFVPVALVFAVLGAGAEKPQDMAGWLGLSILMLIGSVLQLREALNPRRTGVLLNLDGFEVRAGPRRHRCRWDEVAEFRVIQGAGHAFDRHVGVVLTEAARRDRLADLGGTRSRLRGVQQLLQLVSYGTEIDLLLPGTLSVRADELSLVMEAWRASHAATKRSLHRPGTTR